MQPQSPIHTLPSSSGNSIEPGPPNFSEIEGGPHHPSAATTPGAGPNPSPLPPDREDDKPERSPGAATIPGAGPNPGAD